MKTAKAVKTAKPVSQPKLSTHSTPKGAPKSGTIPAAVKPVLPSDDAPSKADVKLAKKYEKGTDTRDDSQSAPDDGSPAKPGPFRDDSLTAPKKGEADPGPPRPDSTMAGKIKKGPSETRDN
jgi:hypothetical protein